MRAVRITAEPLSPAAFAPFGWLPVPDTDPADGVHTLEYAWGDPHLNVIGHHPDEVEHTPDGALRCTRLYRHDSHTQALMSLDVPAVLAVAAAAVDFSGPEHLQDVRAFAVAPLQCFVLHRGTWHWGPFPVGSEPVRLLNVQGRRYRDDNAFVDLLTACGGAVDVVPGGGLAG